MIKKRSLLEELNEAYADIVAGHEEPSCMIMGGHNLKKYILIEFHKLTQFYKSPDDVLDMDGNKIYDGIVYAVTPEGICPIDEYGRRVKVVIQ